MLLASREWVETRDVVQHRVLHRNYLVQSISSAEAEKPRSGPFTRLFSFFMILISYENFSITQYNKIAHEHLTGAILVANVPTEASQRGGQK